MFFYSNPEDLLISLGTLVTMKQTIHSFVYVSILKPVPVLQAVS